MIEGGQCLPINTLRQAATVNRVIDGDTIEVLIDCIVFPLRYIGMDTPESGEIMGDFARNKNYELVVNKHLTLVKDESDTDPYGRLLQYVIADGVLVNYEMVKQGYASAGSWYPDTSCDQVFASAQQQALINQVGMWAQIPTSPPRVNTIATSNSLGSNCHPSYPDVCIPPPPPDLDCPQISFCRFRVLPPDPHGFDGDNDGIGCESC